MRFIAVAACVLAAAAAPSRAAKFIQDPPWLWASNTPELDALLPYNKDGRLSENVVLLKAPAPLEWLEMPGIFLKPTVIEIPAQVFERDAALSDASVRAVCVWQGTPKGYVGDAAAKTNGKVKNFVSWVNKECQYAEIGFISYIDEVLTIDWVDPATDMPSLPHRQTLEMGEKRTRWIGSYVGHTFEVRGSTYKQRFTVNYPNLNIVGQKPDYTTLGRTIDERDKVARVKNELVRTVRVTRVFTDVGFDVRFFFLLLSILRLCRSGCGLTAPFPENPSPP